MTQQTATRTATFSATTSWVGVVLLGAGLTQVALPPSQATSPGPQTASVEYQGFDIPVVLRPVTESTPEIPEPPSKERVPRSVGEVGSQIPEPLGAGVWLGVGTGVLAGGGILAALRRLFARTRSTAVDSSGRID